ncbi:MAG TPA: site-2 protease family protein [Actinomycetota bacterium]
MSIDGLARGIGIALGFLIGIPLHHFVHARVASMMGDRTPRLYGRETLSIKRHFDPIGTAILPGVWAFTFVFGSGTLPVFGYGKARSNSPTAGRRQVVVTAIAGPAATLLAAVALGAAWRVLSDEPRLLLAGAILSLCYMTMIELLPLPGRDGAQILAEFLSPAGKLKYQELARYDVLFVLAIYLLSFIADAVVGLGDPACLLATGDRCVLLPFDRGGFLLI